METLFVIWLAFLGLSFGSFLNVVIARLPEGLSVVSPRSRCPKCGHQLPWYENIPVVSWLLLRGKCSGCKAPISPRYLLVELMTAMLFLAALQRYGWTWPLVSALAFICLLIPLVFIDAEHWVLPFELTLPGIALGVLLHVPLGMGAFVAACVGGAVGFLVFRVMEFLGWLYSGTEALGAGDKYLLAMIGATLGWKAILAVVMLSALQGAVFGVTQLLRTGRAGPARPSDAPLSGPDSTHAGQLAASPATSGLELVSGPPRADEVATTPAAVETPVADAAAPVSVAIAPSTEAAQPLPIEATSGDEADDAREPWTPAFLRKDLPWWKRLALVPYAIFLQDIPDPPPLDEHGEEPEWVPQTTSLPFGPWIGLAGIEVMLLGPAIASALEDTPFRLTAQLLFGA